MSGTRSGTGVAGVGGGVVLQLNALRLQSFIEARINSFDTCIHFGSSRYFESSRLCITINMGMMATTEISLKLAQAEVLKL